MDSSSVRQWPHGVSAVIPSRADSVTQSMPFDPRDGDEADRLASAVRKSRQIRVCSFRRYNRPSASAGCVKQGLGRIGSREKYFSVAAEGVTSIRPKLPNSPIKIRWL